MSQHIYPPPTSGPGSRTYQPQTLPSLPADYSQHHPQHHPSQHAPQHTPQQQHHRTSHPHPHHLLPVPHPTPHHTHLQHVSQQHSLQLTHNALPPPQPQSTSSPQSRLSGSLRTDAPPSAAPPAAQKSSNSAPLEPISRTDETSRRRYQLDVVQQPKRARMCGFGDKDRRPITPPPCVRLVIIDPDTGKEIDYNEIDCTMFVLNVDLWNGDGTQELNHVRANEKSGSVSSSSGGGPIPPELNSIDSSRASHSAYGTTRDQGYLPPAASYAPTYHSHGSGYAQAAASPYQTGQYQQSAPHYSQQSVYRHETPLYSHGQAGSYGRYSHAVSSQYPAEPSSTGRGRNSADQPTGMFTRNLIGSLAASAFRLNDTDGRVGIWFVLQDLSIRTEGPCRLRFSFVDVGSKSKGANDHLSQKINTGRAPIMAACFTEIFTVFSAKKFPGVCESTALSKTFAAQGIKIPVRKDTNARGEEDEEYGD